MKWIVVVLLVVSPLLVNGQTTGKDIDSPLPVCSPKVPSYQSRPGADVNIRGCGRQTSVFYIDGVKMPVRYIQPEAMKPLFEENPSSHKWTRSELNKMPYTDVNEALALFPGVYQQQRGASLNVYGSR